MKTRTIGEGRRAGTVGSRRGSIAVAALLACVTVAAAACKGVLDVQNEQDILDVNLSSLDAIGPLLTGVAGDYAVAYGNAVDIVGLFGGELTHTGSFPSWREVEGGYGKRPSTEADNMYNQIERAIWVADTAAVRIAAVVADASKSPEVAAAKIYGGFAHLLLADNYCQGTVTTRCTSVPKGCSLMRCRSRRQRGATVSGCARSPAGLVCVSC